MLPANCGNFPLSFLLIPSFSLSEDQPGSDRAAAINVINGHAGMGVRRGESLGTCCPPHSVHRAHLLSQGSPGCAPQFLPPQTRQLSTPPAHSPLSIPQFNKCLPPSHLPLLKSKSPEITHSLNNSSSFNKHLSANT